MSARLGANAQSLTRKAAEIGRRRPLASFLLLALLVSLTVILVRTIALGNTGFEDKSLWDWMDLLFVPLALLVGGGILSVSLASVVESAQRRNDLTLEVVKRYFFELDRDTAQVAHILEQGTAEEEDASRRNMIRKTGNWFDFVVTLYHWGFLNKQLIAELGLDQVMCRFVERLEAYNRRTGSKQMIEFLDSLGNLTRMCEQMSKVEHGTGPEVADG